VSRDTEQRDRDETGSNPAREALQTQHGSDCADQRRGSGRFGESASQKYGRPDRIAQFSSVQRDLHAFKAQSRQQQCLAHSEIVEACAHGLLRNAATSCSSSASVAANGEALLLKRCRRRTNAATATTM